MSNTFQRMLSIVSRTENIEDIMFNAYDLYQERLSDKEIRSLVDVYFQLTRDLQKSNRLYQELDRFNNTLIA
jgi:hypothetical protein